MCKRKHKHSNGFIKSASSLILAIFIARIIGAVHRLPLAHILEPAGMGLYQLVFPVYAFLLSASSGSLPIAISMLVSSRLANAETNKAREILKTAMSALLLTSLVLSFVLAILSGPIGKLQGNSDTKLGFICIAPAVFFTSGIAVMRGWFQGNSNMLPSAISQITESVAKLVVGLALAWLLLPYGIAYAVGGALAGVTISEALTFLLLYLVYRKNNPPLKLDLNIKKARSQYKEILKLTIPMTLGGLILPLSQIADSLIALNVRVANSNQALATVNYGLYTGYVGTLINFPIMVALSLGIAVAPLLSKDKAQHNIIAIKDKIKSASKMAFFASAPFTALYIAIPESILSLLYPSISTIDLLTASLLLRVSAVSVIALSATQIYASTLQGLGFYYKPVRSMLFAVCAKIVLGVFLSSRIGILGIAIASCVCFFVAGFANYVSIIRLTGNLRSILQCCIIITITSIIAGVTLVTIDKFTDANGVCLLSALAISIVYCLTLILLGVFTDRELTGLPGSKILLKLSHLIK
ncbi:MAG: polysaccharide biosynthesis protein [Christensenellaceae bacterium]|jgi:stage V sporulation protein B|nr:polysaccharide biosynthesis protein [Christensenellaceae bacterium]